MILSNGFFLKDGMPFGFKYEVVDHYSGNDFGHNSNSDGKVTEGEYRVALPDGRTQVVKYTADHYNGYVAQVTYEGEAQYPQETKQYQQPAQTYSAPAPAPTYSAPAPTYSAPVPSYAPPPAPTYGAPNH